MGRDDYKTWRVHRFNKEIINSELLGMMYMFYNACFLQELLNISESKVTVQAEEAAIGQWSRLWAIVGSKHYHIQTCSHCKRRSSQLVDKLCQWTKLTYLLFPNYLPRNIQFRIWLLDETFSQFIRSLRMLKFKN